MNLANLICFTFQTLSYQLRLAMVIRLTFEDLNDFWKQIQTCQDSVEYTKQQQKDPRLVAGQHRLQLECFFFLVIWKCVSVCRAKHPTIVRRHIVGFP